MKTYITFGFDHTHSINGKTFDKDCVAVINDVGPEEGRARAFELFGPKFCIEYHDSYSKLPNMDYFPRGYIDVE